jgi:hypothetical protein
MYETEKWLVYEDEDFEEDVPIIVEALRPFTKQSKQQRLNERKIVSQILLPFAHRYIDSIFVIPEGGNVLGTYVHYRLKLPLLRNPADITEHTAIGDDIVDTGKTMAKYATKGNLAFALFYHRQSIIVPDIWRHEKLEKWIHFMWEAPEDGDDRI